MKLMKIFGMVFALHVALACVLVLIQGCRSTPGRASDDTSAAAPAVTPVASENWSSQSSSSAAPTSAAAPTESDYESSAPITGPTLGGLSPAERARTEPTRPADPSAYISTGVPAAIAPPPPAPTNYVVRSGDSFWKIARANNTTTREIQRLNPNVKADSLRPGMVLKIPGTASSPLPAEALSPGEDSGVSSAAASSTYVVRSGDSLSKIAARNGTTVAALREANNLRSDVIQIGQSLVIPGGGAATGPSNGSLINDYTPPPAENGNEMTFVVQRGDTLGEIARKFDVTVHDLMAANNISDPRRIRVGQKLVIPGFQAVGTGAIPRPAPAPSRATTSAPSSASPPPTTTTPEPTSPTTDRPPELDAPPPSGEAPPVQPLDDPVPAP